MVIDGIAYDIYEPERRRNVDKLACAAQRLPSIRGALSLGVRESDVSLWRADIQFPASASFRHNP